MVTKEEVEKFMKKYFPECPICHSNKGYEVSGWFHDYVQCRSCGAKWLSADFVKCEELKNMALWEASKDGKGASFLKRKKPIGFWRNFKDEPRVSEAKPIAEISLDADDDVLRAEIFKGLNDLVMHEAGTGWTKMLTILKGTTAEVHMAQMLKAIVDQNKIIIRQNELMYRALKKLTEQRKHDLDASKQNV